MRVKNVTPEQIQALNAGEEIVVLVPMEPQPYEISGSADGNPGPLVWDGLGYYLEISHGHARPFVGGEWKPFTDYCPVAVGETVEAIGPNCQLCLDANELAEPNEECEGCATRGHVHDIVRPTVRHVAHRESKGVHYWEVRLGK